MHCSMKYKNPQTGDWIKLGEQETTVNSGVTVLQNFTSEAIRSRSATSSNDSSHNQHLQSQPVSGRLCVTVSRVEIFNINIFCNLL